MSVATVRVETNYYDSSYNELVELVVLERAE